MHTSSLPNKPYTKPSEKHGCHYCGASPLRRSRFRLADVPWLLLMKWPTRCLLCHRRHYILWTDAVHAISSRAPHAPELAHLESWQHFTAADPKKLRSNQTNEGER